MPLPKPIRWILRAIGGVLALLIAIPLTFAIFQIPIPLNTLRPQLISALEDVFQREVRADGPARLYIGIHPAVSVSKVAVANPADWHHDGDFAKLQRLRASIDILDLLDKRINVNNFILSGVELNLQRDPDGRENWTFPRGDGAGIENTAPNPPAERSNSGLEFVQVRRIDIDDINLTEFNADGSVKYNITLHKATGGAASGQDMTLELDGAVDDSPFSASFSGASLHSLLKTHDLWPLKFTANFASVSVEVEGKIGSQDRAIPSELEFRITAENLKELEPLIGPLPELGSIDLTGTAKATKAGYFLPNLKGHIGETTVDGQLEIGLAHHIPRLDGSLKLGTIDATILKSDHSTDPPPDQKSAAATAPALQAKARPADKPVLPFTGNLTLSIAEFINPKVSVKNLTLGFVNTEDKSTASVDVLFADAPLSGTFSLAEIDSDTQEFDLHLEGHNADIGKLVEFFAHTKGISGNFDHLLYHVSGRGGDIAECWKHRTTELLVERASLTHKGTKKNTDFFLEKGTIDGTQTGPSHYTATGTFKGEDFSIDFTRLKAERATAETPPFLDFKGTGAGASFHMHGNTRLKPDDENPGLSLSVSGNNLGRLSPWIGIAPEANLSYRADGKIYFDQGKWLLENLEATIGQTSLAGTIGTTRQDDPSEHHFITKLNVASLSVPELKSILPHDENKAEKTRPGLDLDMNILPVDVYIDDADVDLSIAHVMFEKRDLANITFKGQIRDGWMKPAPFTVSVGQADLAGELAFDLRDTHPQALVELSTHDIDIGAILHKLEVAKGLDATAETLSISVHARGHTLENILEQSDFGAGFTNAVWTLTDANTGAKLPITTDHVRIEAKAGQPVSLNLDGHVAETPLKFTLSSDGFSAFAHDEETLDFNLQAEIADTKIGLKGDATLPLESTNLDVDLEVSADKLSNLNDLLKTDLPPVGPYTIGGRFRLTDHGYSLSNLAFKTDRSDLTGSLKIDTTAKPPRLDLDLNTHTLQLDEFAFKDWSPKKGHKSGKPKEQKNPDEPGVMEKLEAIDQEFITLLSAERLSSFDANASFRAERIMSGKDRLGGASLDLALQNGRLAINPVKIDLPGGELTAEYEYYPHTNEKTADAKLKIAMSGFEYGVLARRKDPDSDLEGFIDLDVDLSQTNVPLDHHPFANADGHLHFEVCPRHFKAGVIDLWATNLVLALLPQIDPENQSVINCIQARFDLDDGVLTPEFIVLDTSRIRVNGTGIVDFNDQKLSLRLEPTPKKPQFFSIETPITVDGSFKDSHIGLGNLGVGGLIFRMAGNTLLYPVKLFTASRLPRNGDDICSRPLPDHRDHHQKSDGNSASLSQETLSANPPSNQSPP
ncbi:MAG: AsmA-like C-terminal region-containing protein [Verrucomicrobiota bacterium]